MVRAFSGPPVAGPKLKGDLITFENGAKVRIGRKLKAGERVNLTTEPYRVVRYPNLNRVNEPPLVPPEASKDPLPGIVELWDTARSSPPPDGAEWRIIWPHLDPHEVRKLAESILLNEGMVSGMHIREVRPAIWHLYRWGDRIRPPGSPADVRFLSPTPGRKVSATSKYRWEELKPGVGVVYEGASMATLRTNLANWLHVRHLKWRAKMRYVDKRRAVVVTREIIRDAYAIR